MMYENGNKGLLFNKVYFQGTTITNLNKVKSINKSILSRHECNVEIPSPQKIHFSVLYPGVVTGVGYLHDLQSGEIVDSDVANNSYKIGMLFDYTSGMPYISGASIKGAIRSAFCHGQDNAISKVRDYGYIHEVIKEVFGDKSPLVKLSDDDLLELEYVIFCGEKKCIKEGEITSEPMPIRERDIFFDSFFTEAKGQIIGEDTITPHNENPLKDPTPLKFLKVRSGTQFVVNLDIKDTELNSGTIVTEKQKLKIFAQILQDLGVGAKTNVGYGNLKLDTIISAAEVKAREEREIRKQQKHEDKTSQINDAFSVYLQDKKFKKLIDEYKKYKEGGKFMYQTKLKYLRDVAKHVSKQKMDAEVIRNYFYIVENDKDYKG